jgi:protein arginine N-methyltransferase 1
MYDLRGYGGMLADEGRVAAFHESIRSAVLPKSLVLELGTATGIMAFWAVQSGARHVHAVEPESVIHYALQSARNNGLSDRITFHQTVSSKLQLPERADVFIEDMRGAMPCFKTHLPDVIDARARLLVPEARFICQQDLLFVAVASSDKQSQYVHSAWDGAPWGLDFRELQRTAPNCFIKHRCAPADLMSDPVQWAKIHYPKIASPHVRGGAELVVNRGGTAHGLALWFEAELFGGYRISNAPTEPRHTYGSAFVPWPVPTLLVIGDRIEVKLDAVFTGTDYEWNWASTIWRQGMLEPAARYKQSTFQGRPIVPRA